MICYTGHDGKIYAYNQDMFLFNHAWEVVSEYEKLLKKEER